MSVAVLHPEAPIEWEASGEAAKPPAVILLERLLATGWRLEAECRPMALACLALLVRLRPALALSPRHVADVMPMSRERFEMTDLLNVMAEFGYESRVITARPDRVNKRFTPALWIGHGECYSSPDAPAVVQFDGDEPVIFDAKSAAYVDVDALPAHLKKRGRLKVFMKIDERELNQSREQREITGKTWFLTILARFRPHLLKVFAIGVWLNLLALGPTLLIILVFASVIGPGAAEPLPWLAVGAALFVGCDFLLRRARSQALAWIGARLDYLIGIAIMRKLLGLPASALRGGERSDHISRIRSFESIRDAVSGPVFMTALEAPTALVSLVAVFLLAGPLGFVPLVSCIAYGVCLFIGLRLVKVEIARAASRASIAQTFLLESVDRIADIRMDGLSDRWRERLDDIDAREAEAQYRLARISHAGEIIASYLSTVTVLATLAVGAPLVWDGQIQTPILLGCTMLIWRSVAPLHALCAMLARFEQVFNAVRQIDELMDVKEEDKRADLIEDERKFVGRISFENVALRRSGANSFLFTGLNMAIAPGEVVCVAGANGAGRSELLRSILGFEAPAFGAVRIDELDVRQLPKAALRNQVAWLPSRVSLFGGDIAANLRIASPLADETAMLDALAAAGFAEAKEEGEEFLRRPVSEGREANDALFAQSIGLARMLLLDAQVLLIATQSNVALQAGFDATLKSVIRRVAGKKTVLIASNRPDFIRLASRVMLFAPGQPVAIGGPNQMLEKLR